MEKLRNKVILLKFIPLIVLLVLFKYSLIFYIVFRLPSISYSSKAIEPAPSKNFIQDQNSLKDSPIIEMSKIPDRPPRSKDNPSKISTLKFKGSLEVVDGSCDTMKQSCSSSDPAAVTSTPQQSKKSQSSISDLMSGLKINKIAQRCKNIIPKRKKSKKLEEAT